MTTPAALRELADRLVAEADYTESLIPNTVSERRDYLQRRANLMREAATQLRTAASEGVSVHRLPPPDAVEYPDSGFRTDANALALWAAHMYDTGGTPYWGADAMHSLAARAKAEAQPPEVARDAGLVTVPREPTEAQWGGLARDVVMWMQAYQRHDSDSLLKHLDRSGTEIPDWLRKEADTGSHSLPKGSIATIIYKAMLDAAISGAAGVGG